MLIGRNASLGYIVLSVNYRSGIGYGLNFREALNYGAAGGSEFHDVIGPRLYLRRRPTWPRPASEDGEDPTAVIWRRWAWRALRTCSPLESISTACTTGASGFRAEARRPPGSRLNLRR